MGIIIGDKKLAGAVIRGKVLSGLVRSGDILHKTVQFNQFSGLFANHNLVDPTGARRPYPVRGAGIFPSVSIGGVMYGVRGEQNDAFLDTFSFEQRDAGLGMRADHRNVSVIGSSTDARLFRLTYDGTTAFCLGVNPTALYQLNIATATATRIGSATNFGTSTITSFPDGLVWDGTRLLMLHNAAQTCLLYTSPSPRDS